MSVFDVHAPRGFSISPEIRVRYQRYVAAFALLLVMSLLHRAIAIDRNSYPMFAATFKPESDLEGIRQWLGYYGPSFAAGLKADILFAAATALPLMFLGVRLQLAVICALGLFYAANVDHIVFNFANIDLTTFEYAYDPTFVAAMVTGTFVKCTVAMIAAGGIALWLSRTTFGAAAARYLSPLVIVVALALPIRANFLDPTWLQTNPLFPTLSFDTPTVHDIRFPPETFAAVPVADDVDGDYNLLVVYLEGLSAHSLSLGKMETFQKIADENIEFTRYFGNQLITANGLFATLTGRLPSLTKTELKFFGIQEDSEIAETALPTRMSEDGYHTAFLQSANLDFMAKGTILPRLGFEDVKGLESWDWSYSEDGWGIDDRALFSHTLDYLDTLEAGKPWYVSVLTTGTHTPYNFPADFESDAPSRRKKAMGYLDTAIKELFDGLEARGLLENTVVVLTADESREREVEDRLQSDLAVNWLPLVVVHPSGTKAKIDTHLTATQFGKFVPEMVAKDPSDAIEAARGASGPVVFGNVFNRRVYFFDPDTRQFLLCEIVDFNCAEFDRVTDITKVLDRTPDRIRRFPELQELVLLSEEVD